jgi:hypothetical protein
MWGWKRIGNKKFWPLTEEDHLPLYKDGGCDLMIIIGTGLAVFPFASTIF